jgi:hypothetical protein
MKYGGIQVTIRALQQKWPMYQLLTTMMKSELAKPIIIGLKLKTLPVQVVLARLIPDILILCRKKQPMSKHQMGLLQIGSA